VYTHIPQSFHVIPSIFRDRTLIHGILEEKGAAVFVQFSSDKDRIFMIFRFQSSTGHDAQMLGASHFGAQNHL